LSKTRRLFLKLEPDQFDAGVDSENDRGELLPAALPGFRSSPQTIQPRRTLVVDIRGDEEQILGRMKQKTRYNIRLAAKKGVLVRPSSDLDIFYRLMQVTGERDVFWCAQPGILPARL